MKEINKKIGAVALAGTLIVGSGLSQGSISNADSKFIRRSLVNANLLKDHPQDSAYNFVEGYQYLDNYDAIYLGSSVKFNQYIKRTYLSGTTHRIDIQNGRNGRIPDYYNLKKNHRYFYLSFRDGTEFVNNLNRLKPFRRITEPVVVRIGFDYFCFFFNMSTKDRDVLPVKQVIEPFGFSVELAHATDTLYGKSAMQSLIYNRVSERSDVNGDQSIINRLLIEPSNKEDGKSRNVFGDIEHFAYYLKHDMLTIPRGLSRYKIGTYDYIFLKK